MVRLVPREKSGVGRAFCKEEEKERGNRREEEARIQQKQ